MELSFSRFSRSLTGAFELFDPPFVVSDERKDRRLDFWRSRLP